MSIRRWELFPCLLGDYFTEILYCFLAQTFPSVILIVLSLASHFCTHKIILFCLPEHSNHNASHCSGKVCIFSASSFLVNQSFQPQNHFSCSLNCLQFGFFPSNEVAQNWMLYSRQAATRNLDDFHYLLFDTNLRVNMMQEKVCSCKCNSAENMHNLYGLHLMLVLPGICISWIVLFFNPEGFLIKK